MAQNYRRTQTKHRKAKKGQGWTNLLKTIEELKQNTGKLRRDKDGQNWGGLKWIAFG